MDVEVREESAAALRAYAAVSIAFRVREVFDVARERGRLVLSVRRPPEAYRKDYDATSEGGPEGWPRRFDLSRWGIFGAFVESERVGGACVAFQTPGLDLLEGRSDLAVLWDIRVAPGMRGRGVGSHLFVAAEAWAAERGCRELKVETQDVNVSACRFYVRCGCVLRGAQRGVYPEYPKETQLLWYKDLGSWRARHRS